MVNTVELRGLRSRPSNRPGKAGLELRGAASSADPRQVNSHDSMLFPVLIGGLVVAMVVLLCMALRRNRRRPQPSGSTRSSARNSRKDAAADMLLKQALQEADKKTPAGPAHAGVPQPARRRSSRPTATSSRARCSASRSAWRARARPLCIWLVNIYVAPVGAGRSSSLPWMWLCHKRRDAAEEVRRRSCPTRWNWSPGPCGPATRWPPACTSSPRKCRRRSREEFGRVYEEQNLGIPLEEALKGMCDRVPNLDLRFFVTSVAIQRQTGGDLAEILDKIGYVIRERFRILGQVKALTAEGRLSGVVLIALPFGLFLLMLHMKPDYVELLWTDPMGIKMTIARDHPGADRRVRHQEDRGHQGVSCSGQWSVPVAASRSVCNRRSDRL